MQRILIPIDFTSRSRNVLTYIAKIYNTKENHFILYNNYAKNNTEELLISVEDIIEDEIRHKLEKEASILLDNFKSDSLSFEIKIGKGEFVSNLKQQCLNDQIDLVIIGSENGNSWKVNNSDQELSTFNLVKHIKCPTLIFPNKSEIGTLKEIVFATRLNTEISERDVRPLISILSSTRAHLDIVSFIREGNNAVLSEPKLKALFKGIPYKMYVINNLEPYTGILQFSKQRQADLLCITYRKTSFLERLLRESVSKQMLNDLIGPILVLKQYR